MAGTDLEQRLTDQCADLRRKIRKVRLWNTAIMFSGVAWAAAWIGLSKMTGWHGAGTVGLIGFFTVAIWGILVMLVWVGPKTSRAASLDAEVRSMHSPKH